MEDNLQWQITLDEKHPSMEDNLGWRTTFDLRRPSMEFDMQNYHSYSKKHTNISDLDLKVFLWKI